MKKKVKVLVSRPEKYKSKASKTPKGLFKFENLIEEELPDVYEFICGYGEDDIIKQVDRFRPELIFIGQSKLMDALGLLKKIKQLHPPATVFIIFGDIVDDEQETIDEYMAAGAYKCYLIPFGVDTLIHDMYVALNLE